MMNAKILTKGPWAEPGSFQIDIVCNYCGSTSKIVEEQITRYWHDSIAEGFFIYRVICLCCGQNVFVGKKNIPGIVQDRIPLERSMFRCDKCEEEIPLSTLVTKDFDTSNWLQRIFRISKIKRMTFHECKKYNRRIRIYLGKFPEHIKNLIDP